MLSLLLACFQLGILQLAGRSEEYRTEDFVAAQEGLDIACLGLLGVAMAGVTIADITDVAGRDGKLRQRKQDHRVEYALWCDGLSRGTFRHGVEYRR